MKNRIISVMLCVIMILLTCSCTLSSESNKINAQGEDIELSSKSQTETETETGTTSNSTSNSNSKTATKFAVSTSNKFATKVGADVLEKGGNAVDAAIAVAYALSVVEPYASGIGGGGGMLIYNPDNKKYTFLNYMPEVAQSGTTDYQIGVPGMVSGMQKAHDLFGKTDLSQLIQYSIDYAQKGFEVDEKLAYRIDQFSSSFSSSKTPFNSISKGDTLVQPQLTNILKELSKNGSKSFYSGKIADTIVANTTLKKSDLESYQTIISEPVKSSFGGYDIVSAPSPFSGVMLIQMVKMLSMSNYTDSNEYLKTLVNSKILSASERAKYSCDQRFSSNNNEYEKHLSTEYIKSLLSKPADDSYDEKESEDTTHVSIIDGNGMVVSMTNTISSFWGSKRYVDGFFINNSLRNFSSSGINACQPQKRGRTYISPTIISQKNGNGIFAIGTPGGNVITTILSEIITDICLLGDDAETAVSKKRIVVQDSNTLIVETGINSSYIADPKKTNYYLVSYDKNEFFGSVNIAGFSTKKGYYTASDNRRNGSGMYMN